ISPGAHVILSEARDLGTTRFIPSLRGISARPASSRACEGSRHDPLHPERSEGSRHDPLHPERSEGSRRNPLHPERSEGSPSETEILRLRLRRRRLVDPSAAPQDEATRRSLVVPPRMTAQARDDMRFVECSVAHVTPTAARLAAWLADDKKSAF